MTNLLILASITATIVFYFLTRLKLNKMADVNTAVEADVSSLKSSLKVISDKIGSIGADSGNVLTEQSKKDLDDVTATFAALANAIDPPPVEVPAEPTPDAPPAEA